jgi:hypothetical protein
VLVRFLCTVHGTVTTRTQDAEENIVRRALVANREALRGALVLGVAGFLPGCSFLFTTAPRHPEPSAQFDSNKCTTSKAAPIADTLIAGLEVARTGFALSADNSTYDRAPISRAADVGLGVGFVALFGASAIYGYYVTGACSARRQGVVVVEHQKEPEDREPGDPDASPAPAPRQQWNTSRPVTAPRVDPSP